MSDTLEGVFAEFFARLTDVERRQAMVNMGGPVRQRDKDKGVRIQIGGTDSDPVLSPWIQPGGMNGRLKSRYLPAIGENVLILSLGGDMMQACAIPWQPSNANPNPAEHDDEVVIMQSPDGKVRQTERQNKIATKAEQDTLTVGNTVVDVKKESVEQRSHRVLAQSGGGKVDVVSRGVSVIGNRVSIN